MLSVSGLEKSMAVAPRPSFFGGFLSFLNSFLIFLDSPDGGCLEMAGDSKHMFAEVVLERFGT